jgi:hypothetical protein
VADGIRARPHSVVALDTATDITRYRVFAYPSGSTGRKAGRAFPTSSTGPGGSRALLVELLLMSQEQVAAREASCALRAFEGLLFCVGSLMSLQMF